MGPPIAALALGFGIAMVLRTVMTRRSAETTWLCEDAPRATRCCNASTLGGAGALCVRSRRQLLDRFV